jgi:hypothetical protein
MSLQRGNPNGFMSSDTGVLRASAVASSFNTNGLTTRFCAIGTNLFTSALLPNGASGIGIYNLGTASTIDGYTVIDGFAYAVSLDTDAYILLITNEVLGGDLWSNVSFGGEAQSSFNGVSVMPVFSGTPDSYGVLPFGTRNVRSVIVGGMPLLGVKYLISESGSSYSLCSISSDQIAGLSDDDLSSMSI